MTFVHHDLTFSKPVESAINRFTNSFEKLVDAISLYISHKIKEE